MIAQLFYYESFPMENMRIMFAQIQKMQKFAKENKLIIEQNHKGLIDFATKVIIEQKKQKLKKQHRQT